jgi:two-component system response regulator FlrC
VAQANVTALIEGPTGAGKEILARVLHESSKRARGPFVGLNCAALPEQLIDDMLFGHEKGAFTGAQKEFKGLFEQAQGGTLFLDEIGEMPMHLQAKLLRVLQERLLTRLGSERQVAIDVRIIAATNKDLRVAIADREFREDLYFRISTFKLRVPPLRERKGDILPLVASLLMRHAPNAQEFTLSDDAQAQLLAYPWPGNVRELENVVQRAVVLCADQHIESHHLMFDDAADMQMHLAQELAATPVANATPVSSFNMPTQALPFPDTSATEDNAFIASNLQEAVKTSEHQMILAAIQTTESRMEAAAKLGISPRTLRYKLAKLKADNSTMALAA